MMLGTKAEKEEVLVMMLEWPGMVLEWPGGKCGRNGLK